VAKCVQCRVGWTDVTVVCPRSSAVTMDKSEANHGIEILLLAEDNNTTGVKSTPDSDSGPLKDRPVQSVWVRTIASVSFGPPSAFNTGRTDVGTNAFRPLACLIPLIGRAGWLYMTGQAVFNSRRHSYVIVRRDLRLLREPCRSVADFALDGSDKNPLFSVLENTRIGRKIIGHDGRAVDSEIIYSITGAATLL